ncbi:MAG: hypothetical protein ABEJ75_04260 [Candidatus Nanohaloarchaea archaeon]
MGFFQSVVQTMAEAGFNLFLPWLLMLAVTYGLLNKYNVVSDEAQVNGAIAIALAFLAIIGVNRFAPPGMWSHFAADIAFGIFGMLALLILLGVAGQDLEDMGGSWSLPWIFGGGIAVISFLSALVRYGSSGAVTGGGNLFDEVVMPILTLIFVMIIVYLTTQEV